MIRQNVLLISSPLILTEEHLSEAFTAVDLALVVSDEAVLSQPADMPVE